MRVARQVAGKGLVAGVLVALIVSGCSSQGTRSALEADIAGREPILGSDVGRIRCCRGRVEQCERVHSCAGWLAAGAVER